MRLPVGLGCLPCLVCLVCLAWLGCIDRELPVLDAGTDAMDVGSDAMPGADGGSESGTTVNACGGGSDLPPLGSACGACSVTACDGSDGVRCAYQPGDGCPPFRDDSLTAGVELPATGVLDWGPGVSAADLDGDGLLELIHSGTDGLVVFRGDPTDPTAPYLESSASFGLDTPLAGDAAAAVDFDGDGDLDVAVTGKNVLTLWRNDAGLFVDVTAALGVSLATGANGLAWGDADGDGDLDLYVSSYEQEDGSHLLRNDGTAFVDVTLASGVGLPGARSFQPVWIDYDADGDLDLFVANDIPGFTGVPLALFANLGGGTFGEEALAAGLSYWIDGMGVAVGDPDLDGDPDLFLTNVPGVPAFGFNTLLFLNRGAGTFREESVLRGASVERYSWGAAFFDFDNDGDEDLFVAAEPWMGVPGVRDVLLRNDGTGSFEDVSAGSGADRTGDTFGALAADVDNDGDLDLLLSGRNAERPLALLRNLGNPGRWLKVRLDAPGPNTRGVGATVIVHTGDRTQTRWIRAGESIHCFGPPEAHFGLADAPRADEVRVLWPDGAESVLSDVALDRTLVVVHP